MDIIFREYGHVIWRKKGYFFLALISLASAMTLDISAPLIYKELANGLTAPYSDQTAQALWAALQKLALLYCGIWLSWRLLEIAIIPLDGGGVNLLEKRCFEVLRQQQYRFFENQFSGSLIKQAHRFAHAFESIMDWILFQFYMNLWAIAVAFTIFYQQQPKFALIFLIWVMVFIAWNIAFSSWKLRFDEAAAASDSKLGGIFSDAISNINVVKTFTLENQEQSRINQAADQVYRKKKIAWIWQFFSFAVQGLLTFGIELYMIRLMIQQWQAGSFQIGDFVLFQSVMVMLIQRLWEFGRNFRNVFTALADAAEMAEIIRQHDIEKESPHAKPITINHGKIEFKNITFSYSAAESDHAPLFEDFNLHIKAGEKIALVGLSGSGKSSLTKLLFRFIEPQIGSIHFDDIDAKSFSLVSLRQQISMVPQQAELFHRSIRDNIALGADISEVRLQQIAQQAQCLGFIQQLPEQFETLVGERGVKLSGGEKQRIAIARAFLEDAPIVVLDEATSALDSITEQQIQTAIFSLIEHKTALVIAHRLSTILRMDRIIVLDKGKIIEQGSHEELLAQKGQYCAMWQHQQGNFLPLRS